MNADDGVCIGIWKRMPRYASESITYQCESSLASKYQCLSHPVITYETIDFHIITTCCQTDYCNTPDYLMSFVNTSVLGKLYSQTPSVRSFV